MTPPADGRWTTGQSTWVVDFPVLWVAVDWEERHAVISDPVRGVHLDEHGDPEPFTEYAQQLWVTVNWYRVRPTAKPGDLARAFHYRRALYVGPQKVGKGPWLAKKTKGQAAGPVLFDGWATGGETYSCDEHGCPCGWVYTYGPGEAMGKPWAKPLMQLMATSEDQVDNVYGPLQAMLKHGWDAELYTVGEEFSRLPGDGKIESVTSSALSRLGNPIIFAGQDETGLYNDQNKLRRPAETQRRGAAAMGGRSIETTNPWDPSEDSVAQRTWESKRPDIFRFWLNPELEVSLRHADTGKAFSFWVKRERRKILAHVYQGIDHVQLEGVEAEALEIGEKDPGQAERFYGNTAKAGLGTWLEREQWDRRAKPQVVAPGTAVVAAFDGSDIDDWTGFRCETRDGYQFTPTFPDGEPMIWDPADFGGQVPRLDVTEGLAHIAKTYRLVRGYFDPPYWETEIDGWAETYGDEVILRWPTFRPRPMHAAIERLLTDVTKKDSTFTHDGCETTGQHIANARKAKRLAGRYILAKPGDGRKIDMAIPSILAHEAAGDVTAADAWPAPAENFAYVI